MFMSVLLAVNGTLMRGLELCKNMEDAGAEFVKEDATAPCYRLWSVNDNNPAMLKVKACILKCGRSRKRGLRIF